MRSSTIMVRAPARGKALSLAMVIFAALLAVPAGLGAAKAKHSEPSYYRVQRESAAAFNAHYWDERSNRRQQDVSCGYRSCPTGSPDMLNVHIVSHSHDDVGWLKTVDQYYYGARSEIQNAGVQYIIDSYLDELLKDENKRFIQVETAFFKMWWDEQSAETRADYRRMVDEGRLEFVGGGWSMNDEAAAHYTAIVDNMAGGWKFLEDTFGTCGRPKIAWQIDPFGHAREQAAIFAEMGMDALFIARLDFRDKAKRMSEKSMEFVWRANPRLGSKSELFTAVTYNNYAPPPGFCFDLLCSDVIIDNPKSPDYNADEKVAELIKWAEDEARAFKTNHIMITMGEDFHYQDAHVWFKNLDKLIRYVNAEQATGSKVNLFYSTPSCYVKALNEAGQEWSTKTDDFFPYASDPHAFWTGYFISRPTLKGMVRTTNSLLQATKQMSSLIPAAAALEEDLNTMREAVAINQHHDAVTGTAKQHVTNDYYRILAEAADAGERIFAAAADSVLGVMGGPRMDYSFCPLLNVSECAFTEAATSGQFVVTVYNPLARPQSPLIVFPVTATNGGSARTYTITDPDGNDVPNDVFPLPQPILTLPGRRSNAAYQVHFVARDLPPLGFATYHVAVSGKVNRNARRAVRLHRRRNSVNGRDVRDITFANDYLVLRLDETSGHIKSLSRKDAPNVAASVRHEFLYYKGMAGSNSNATDRASGAYVFRPDGEILASIADELEISSIQGDVLTEIRAYTSDWASHVIRMRKDSDVLESEWLAGPIPISDGRGKELISRYTTNIANGDTYYTDSNAKLTELRRRDYRPTFNLIDNYEPVSQNYYPVISRAYIRDESDADPSLRRQLTLLTDRAQGGGSIHDSELELMIHRRLLHDDAFGVREALNETAYGEGLVARGVHKVILTSVDTAARSYREEEVRSFHKPQYAFAPTTLSAEKWKAAGYNKRVAGVKTPLPENLNLMTLEPWRGGKILMRLEHLFEPSEDAELSNSVQIELLDILNVPVSRVEETDLSGSQVTPARLKWKHEESGNMAEAGDEVNNAEVVDDLARGVVTVRPTEIRTFLLTLA